MVSLARKQPVRAVPLECVALQGAECVQGVPP